MASRTAQLVNKTLYQMSVAACFGAVVWVGFSVYQALSVVPKVDVPPETLETMSVDLDQKALDAISLREQLSTNIDSLILETSTNLPSPKPSSSISASGSSTTR